MARKAAGAKSAPVAPGFPGATAPSPFGAPPGAAPSPFGAPPIPQQNGSAPSPFGAPPPAAAPASPFGAPPAPPVAAPPPSSPFAAAPSLPAMAGQVNQEAVMGIMQGGGAGVTGDPAVASAIQAIMGSISEINKTLKQLETQHITALNEAGKRIAELTALVKGGQAAKPSAPAAPAPPAPTAEPQAGSVEHFLQITSGAVAAHMQQNPGQFFSSQDAQVWNALSTIASQNNINITPEQCFQTWQQAGKINQAGQLVP